MINSTLHQINACKEYIVHGNLRLTTSLFGSSISGVFASLFNQKTTILSSSNCLIDSVYTCASVTQETALRHLYPTILAASDSWEHVVHHADKVTYCALLEGELVKNALWGALSNAHYIAIGLLGIGFYGYTLYRSCCDKPREPQIALDENRAASPPLNHAPRPLLHLPMLEQVHTTRSAPAA